MNKSELLNWLQREYQNWEALLDRIGLARMHQPGVNGAWSMKDVVAHLSGWNRWLVMRLQAAGRGKPEPLPPWPVDLQTDDEINAWIYESNRERTLREILDETRQVHQELLAVIEGLPDNVRIETIHGSASREFYILWVDDQRFPAGEFFDHFQDDHEPDVRVWLARIEKQR